jgi:hypothetical protein
MRSKLTIEEMEKLALERNGKCLSKEYINAYSKLEWECNKGHKWGARPFHVKSGSWCPICAREQIANSQKLTIAEMQDLAGNKEGKCLSEKYVNSYTKLTWQCKKGHKWNAVPYAIKRGEWCPTCSHISNITAVDMHEIAKRRGGKCLSNHYKGNHTKLLWECDKGHTWEATPGSIKSGSWCPHCAGTAKLTIKWAQKLAERRGGKCLSKKYINIDTILKWQCDRGHTWHARPINIRLGTWCPLCSPSLGERLCREYLEIIFKKKFPKTKPNWLLNNSGNKMELDGYCEELKLAFEYHGHQHYFNTTRIKNYNLKQRKKDDRLKEELCKKNGLRLLIIPFTIPNDTKQKYIINECKKNGVELPKDIKWIDFKTLNVYRRDELKELQDLAKKRGGKCLSKVYVDSQTKLKWQCNKGHIWEAIPASVKYGRWCRKCAGLEKMTIQDMQDLAENKEGKCLSTEYLNANSKLEWECSKGHKWKATPASIKFSSWCPHCAGTAKLSIQEMRMIAENMQGKCLSKTYTNNKVKLKWQCNKGHTWEAIPDAVKRGTWCPHCAKNKRIKRCG